MQAIPAIDIRGGRCVRLLRGDFANETDYGDPLVQARRLVSLGAERLHVVDLDAARTGKDSNYDLVLEIARAIEVPIEVGGGIRDYDRASYLLDGGVDRVVLGTAGVEDPTFAIGLAKAYPGRVVLGLDHRRVRDEQGERRMIAVRGWEEQSDLSLEEAIGRYQGVPLGAVIITDISVDGTLEGPDLIGYQIALALCHAPVIASGGIGNLEHLRALGALVDAGRRLSGVVIGRALYVGAMTLEEAIAACAA